MDNDIVDILLRIKDNIKAVETGDTNTAFIMHEIERDFLDLLELIKLFLISMRDSYYGYIFMNMTFRVMFYADCMAGIRLNTFPAVLESNPLLLCKLSLNEIIYVICHEIDHIVLNHPTEMIRLNPEHNLDIHEKLNLAMDASVNDRLNHEASMNKLTFMTAPNGLITSETLKEVFALIHIESLENFLYYYNLIKDKKDEETQYGQILMSQFSGLGDTENEASGHDSDNEDTLITSQRYGILNDHDWQAGEDAEDAVATVRELLNSAVDMMNDEIRGLIPASFLSQVEIINRPPVIKWQELLKKYFGTISANSRKTRTRLNRRQPERFDLPGRMDDKILKIVVAIDTSGSVSNKEVADIFNEIFTILAKRKHDITVIECDAKVQRVYKARTAHDIKTKVKGRGGTKFTPVIEYINNNRYYRDALLIYFTDGYGESKIPRPMTYRNLWVVLDDANRLSLSEPYGMAIAL